MRIPSAAYQRSVHHAADLPRDGRPQVAFVGRSNVGKSSLLNRLVQRKGLARVSGTPGRTRAIHLFLVDERFYFVDLPGYGYARTSKDERRRWQELMHVYFTQAEPPPFVVHLVDARVGATALDVQAHEYLTSLELSVQVVATKIDGVGRSRRPSTLKTIQQRLPARSAPAPLAVSARTGEGITDLWRAVVAGTDSRASDRATAPNSREGLP